MPVAVTVRPVVSARAVLPRSAHRTPATSSSTHSASRCTVPVRVRAPRTRSPRRSPSVGPGVTPPPFGRGDGSAADVLALAVGGAVAAVGSPVAPGEGRAAPAVGELEADGPAAPGAASVFAAQPTVAAAMAAVASRRTVRISPSTVRRCGGFPEARSRASGNRGWSEQEQWCLPDAAAVGGGVQEAVGADVEVERGGQRERERGSRLVGGPTRRHLMVSGVGALGRRRGRRGRCRRRACCRRRPRRWPERRGSRRTGRSRRRTRRSRSW